jgi:radical SAM protein with 4Fe4S-binding SPASM domain
MMLWKRKRYFCQEPWTGVLSIGITGDVIFCPCYLQMKIGNVNQSSLQEVWNSPALVALRESFARGKLPKPCRSQSCPVAVGKQKHKLKSAPSN